MHAVLIGALVLGAAIWIGGFVTLLVLSPVSRRTLRPEDRVALFRGFGRSYLSVASIGAILIIVPGGILLAQRGWDGLATALVILVACTVVATGIGVAQARAMTRLRRAALDSPDDLMPRVERSARRALVLRSAIGLLTVAMYVVAIACAAG